MALNIICATATILGFGVIALAVGLSIYYHKNPERD